MEENTEKKQEEHQMQNEQIDKIAKDKDMINVLLRRRVDMIKEEKYELNKTIRRLEYKQETLSRELETLLSLVSNRGKKIEGDKNAEENIIVTEPSAN